ncbi:protease modulator HflC [Novosphingobium aerophilum]|uniref:protease modulator HflC n=1 Tax=Novosphingobium TaxID=165696 RepID=UPI0006C89627|nr:MULTISPECIES: protease modulator HflC [unclassified Novosphingobium]KPH60664.1 membrane protease subunit HflC [Novosphingobium sp. ST904]MPS67897.1 protease modulator HflC [Novosphingobium sp.]TCM39315.1 protease FtsH subunit HflC [Novosphingobium sp. ST904]WRT92867.1 protease modulator HflC [Novosphingobium sp. RL4]
MNRLWQDYKAAWFLGGAAVVGLMLSMIVVPETEQAVIVRTGRPIAVYNPYVPKADYGQTGAGVHFRIPMVDRVIRIDKRLLSVDMQQQQVLSTDQLRLNVDAYARYRIIDPVKMVETAGTSERVTEQLEPILSSVLRQELGKRTFQSLLTAERGKAMENIRDGLDREAREYGAQVVDVRIKRADLPEGALESAFTRMQASRDEEAKTITAQGQKDAQIIQADAEAQASKIYAAAFGKDPQFYDFYRSMQSYGISFAKGEAGKTILLSPDNAYLNHFREP